MDSLKISLLAPLDGRARSENVIEIVTGNMVRLGCSEALYIPKADGTIV